MLYVECWADEALARCLGLCKRDISHELNKDEVLKRVFEASGCLGMVDEDPDSRPPIQLGRMLKQEDCLEWGIARYINSRRSNQLIVLCPNLEGWLIRTAEIAGVRIGEPPYSLPTNSKSLHRVINGRLDKVALLVNDLQAANSPRIQKLQELLTS